MEEQNDIFEDLNENTTVSLLARRARETPEKPFIVWLEEEGKRISYSEFDRITSMIACGLAKLGLKRRRNLAILLPNCLEAWYTLFAAHKLGGVCVPINVFMKGEGLGYILKNSRPSILVTNSELFMDKFREDILPIKGFETIKHVVFVDKKIPQEGIFTHHLSDLYIDERYSPTRVHKMDVGCILWTSGTTGPPKGVVMTHAYLIHAARAAIKATRLLPSDKMFCVLPLYHLNALSFQTLAVLYTGATMCLSKWFSASRFWNFVKKYHITQFNFYGPILSILMSRPESEEDSNSSLLRVFGIGCPKGIWREFEKRFNTMIFECYGLTECGIVTYYTLDDWKRKPGSAGSARVKGVTFKVLKEDGGEARPNEVGEIVLKARRGREMFLKYLEDPEDTRESTTKDGWFHTGDSAYLDEDGTLWFVDRLKDAIRVRGEMVSSWLVEKAISGHPDVVEVAVIGVPSELGDQDIKAFIILKEGKTLTPEELMKFCEARLPYFTIPRYVEYVKKLPKTPTHKIQKYRLREIRRTGKEWDREETGYKLAKK